jgi:RHS repeat-associated protein
MYTNHAGAAAEDMLFYPWGDVWQSWGSGGYNFAKLPYRDLSTNTDLTTARVFGPDFGRWFTPDPIGEQAVRLDDPQTWNMYAYVRNNPTTLTDPSGLDGDQCTGSNTEHSNAKTCAETQQAIKGSVAAAVTLTQALEEAGIRVLAELPLGGAIGAVIGAGIGLISNVSDTLVENYKGEEQQAAIESVVTVENAQKLSLTKSDSGGVTSSGQRTDEYGNKLGPSGKPQVNEVDHATRKAAKDAARAEGRGEPVRHTGTRGGKPHFHPTDAEGEKIPSSTHHNYPD